jgi:hypothetical protein
LLSPEVTWIPKKVLLLPEKFFLLSGNLFCYSESFFCYSEISFGFYDALSGDKYGTGFSKILADTFSTVLLLQLHNQKTMSATILNLNIINELFNQSITKTTGMEKRKIKKGNSLKDHYLKPDSKQSKLNKLKIIK